MQKMPTGHFVRRKKEVGSRDKLHEDMNGWPSTGWSGRPRTPDSIFVTRATTKRQW
jgi:hypothetical protein